MNNCLPPAQMFSEALNCGDRFKNFIKVDLPDPALPLIQNAPLSCSSQVLNGLAAPLNIHENVSGCLSCIRLYRSCIRGNWRLFSISVDVAVAATWSDNSDSFVTVACMAPVLTTTASKDCLSFSNCSLWSSQAR